MNNALVGRWVFFLAIDPINTQTIYAGTYGGGVFKSLDGGSTWYAINAGLTNLHIYSLAIDPTNTQTVYAGTEQGGVFKSTNGGSSWSAVNTGLTYTYVSVSYTHLTLPTILRV